MDRQQIIPILSGSAYIVKYNTNGTFQWAKTVSGQAGDWGKRCVTDGSGNVYVTGLKISNNGDTFLSKYSSSGTPSWSFVIAGANGDAGQSIFVEGNSYVYIGGYFTGTGSAINFNPLGPPYNLTLPQSDNDFYVAKYNTSDGTRVWVRNLDLILHAPDHEINGMRISNGKIVIAGNLKGSGDFNPCGTSGNYLAANLDAFITGYNTSDPAFTITGPDAVCNSGSFTFTAQGVPPGSTVSWSTNPSNLLSPSSGTGTTFNTKWERSGDGYCNGIRKLRIASGKDS